MYQEANPSDIMVAVRFVGLSTLPWCLVCSAFIRRPFASQRKIVNSNIQSPFPLLGIDEHYSEFSGDAFQQIPTQTEIMGKPQLPNMDEIIKINNRLDKLERTIAAAAVSSPKLQTPASSSSATKNLMNSIAANAIELNSKTVEICSIISFFFIGSFIAASMFDKLWLGGGIIAAWWASETVNENSSAGQLTRRVGVQLAQLAIDVQEKYNQAMIFYKTGKLAYVSSKMWEKYDKRLQVTERVDMFKRLAMLRATEFNNYLGETKLTDQLHDLWRVVAAAPTEARRFDNRYKVSTYFTSSLSSVGKVGRRVGSTFTNLFSDMGGTADSYRALDSYNDQSENGSKLFSWLQPKRRGKAANAENGVLSRLGRALQGDSARRRIQRVRGGQVNPWDPFWRSLQRKDKGRGPRSAPYFSFIS